MKCRTKNASYIYEVGETIEITVLTTKQTTKGTVGTKSINVVRILTRIGYGSKEKKHSRDQVNGECHKKASVNLIIINFFSGVNYS